MKMTTSLIVDTLWCIFRKWSFKEVVVIIGNDKTRSVAIHLMCEAFRKRTTQCIRRRMFRQWFSADVELCLRTSTSGEVFRIC